MKDPNKPTVPEMRQEWEADQSIRGRFTRERHPALDVDGGEDGYPAEYDTETDLYDLLANGEF